MDNAATVERWLGAFNDGWPNEATLAPLLTDDVEFIVRPNLVTPAGSHADAAGMRAGLAAGRALLAWQRYDLIDHVDQGDRVVARFRWTGEVRMDAGPLRAGSTLRAWCVGYFTFREGRICRIEQYDCYEPLPVAA